MTRKRDPNPKARKKPEGEDKPEFMMVRPKGSSLTHVPGTNIAFVSSRKGETCDYVICVKLTIPLIMPDNLVGNCSLCNTAIQWAVDAPKKPPRLCIECLAIRSLAKH